MRFEAGKTYKVYDKGTVTVVKRSAHYVTLSGLVDGRFMVNQGKLYRENEYVILPANTRGFKWFCIADDFCD